MEAKSGTGRSGSRASCVRVSRRDKPSTSDAVPQRYLSRQLAFLASRAARWRRCRCSSRPAPSSCCAVSPKDGAFASHGELAVSYSASSVSGSVSAAHRAEQRDDRNAAGAGQELSCPTSRGRSYSCRRLAYAAYAPVYGCGKAPPIMPAIDRSFAAHWRDAHDRAKRRTVRRILMAALAALAGLDRAGVAQAQHWAERHAGWRMASQRRRSRQQLFLLQQRSARTWASW